MPAKINMIISNGHSAPMPAQHRQINTASLAIAAPPRAPTALNAPFIARVHNVRPGCGACGRK